MTATGTLKTLLLGSWKKKKIKDKNNQTADKLGSS